MPAYHFLAACVIASSSSNQCNTKRHSETTLEADASAAATRNRPWGQIE